MNIFNRKSFVKHRLRAKKEFKQFDYLLQEVVRNIKDRLEDFDKKFPIILDLGARSGYFRDLLVEKGELLIESEYDYDLLSFTDNPAIIQIVGDDELIALKNLDLIISCLNFHFINDLPGALAQMRQALNRQGMLVASFFGGESLNILRESFLKYEMQYCNNVSPHIIPMIDVKQVAVLLQRVGFDMQVVDNFNIEVEYDSINHMFYELRAMGESNILIKMKNYGLSKQAMLKIEEIYRQLNHGKITANFEIITITGFRY